MKHKDLYSKIQYIEKVLIQILNTTSDRNQRLLCMNSLCDTNELIMWLETLDNPDTSESTLILLEGENDN